MLNTCIIKVEEAVSINIALKIFSSMSTTALVLFTPVVTPPASTTPN